MILPAVVYKNVQNPQNTYLVKQNFEKIVEQNYFNFPKKHLHIALTQEVS